VEPRHRLAGAHRELLDDAVHSRLLLRRDRVGLHRLDRDLVGVPVAVEGGGHTDQREQPDVAAVPDQGAHAEEQSPDAAEEQCGLGPVVVVVHVRGTLHPAGVFRQKIPTGAMLPSTSRAARTPIRIRCDQGTEYAGGPATAVAPPCAVGANAPFAALPWAAASPSWLFSPSAADAPPSEALAWDAPAAETGSPGVSRWMSAASQRT